MTQAETAGRAGIIAAGDGARLKAAYPSLPKPLVPLSGRPLCVWVAEALFRAGLSELTVLVNSRGSAVPAALSSSLPKVRWRFLQRDTDSSWESFRLVASLLARESQDFVISTVDALVAPARIADFVREARGRASAAALALTGHIDDEKPLWADVGSDGLVAALGSDARQRRHATAGLYYMTRGAAQELPASSAHDSLRGYLGGLVRGGAKVAGIDVSKALDVDRPEDLARAEDFLKESLSW